DLVAPVDVEDADLAELGAGGLTRCLDEIADRHVLRDGDGDVLPDGGEGDHVPVHHRAADRGEEAAEIELEDSPLPFELARMKLAEDARVRRRGLTRMEQGVLGTGELGLDLERAVQRLDHALDVEETAFGDAGDG